MAWIADLALVPANVGLRSALRERQHPTDLHCAVRVRLQAVGADMEVSGNTVRGYGTRSASTRAVAWRPSQGVFCATTHGRGAWVWLSSLVQD